MATERNVPAVSAAAINDAHRCARESAENAVEWAMKCGQMLAELKASLPRGEFDGWIESKCEFSRATAYNYIKHAKSSNALDGSAIRHLFPSGRPGAKTNTSGGAVSVVNPEGGRTTATKEGTEETGKDRPAASATSPERASQPPGAEIRPGERLAELEDDAPDRPSDEEFAAIDREIQESEARVLRADDVTTGYHDELKRQAAEIAVLKTTRDGYMRGKDAVTKMLEAAQRKVERLEKENQRLRDRLATLEGRAA